MSTILNNMEPSRNTTSTQSPNTNHPDPDSAAYAAALAQMTATEYQLKHSHAPSKSNHLIPTKVWVYTAISLTLSLIGLMVSQLFSQHSNNDTIDTTTQQLLESSREIEQLRGGQ